MLVESMLIRSDIEFFRFREEQLNNFDDIQDDFVSLLFPVEPDEHCYS